MSPLMVIQALVRSLSRIYSNMRLHMRLRLWVGLALAYVLFMGFIQLFHVPLRSNALHSHYDLSAEGVFAKHHAVVKKEAEKYAKAALKDSTGLETAQQISLLTETFKKADSNTDGFLEMSELSVWITAKIKEHLTMALKENFFMFTAIDQDPRNGVVSWNEFQQYFLKQHGYDDKYIEEHKKNHKGMPRELKETIMRDKAMWSEAARDNPDQLTIDEFLAFRHPESSHATILSIVEETISRLDIDGDNKLSEDEFSDPDMNEVPDDLTVEQYRNDRQREFKIADEDNSGKLDRRELLILNRVEVRRVSRPI
ncbi:45 kDa calcium-binding protein isoform X2 [Cherax quadricarinatus]|uniref:45 kDa calcium-binding protein isoform X2 n=1 Tax=Cherax quadricarinatus TaxID=27406 RepID=UPI00387EDEB9